MQNQNEKIGSSVVGGSAPWISFDERHPEIGQEITIRWKAPYEGGEIDCTWGGKDSIDWNHECIPDVWQPWVMPNKTGETRHD